LKGGAPGHCAQAPIKLLTEGGMIYAGESVNSLHELMGAATGDRAEGSHMDTDDGIDALITVGARLLGIVVLPEWHEAIRLHLTISLDHGRSVAAFPLPDETDPAPVFSP
jgi:hypothetical protein